MPIELAIAFFGWMFWKFVKQAECLSPRRFPRTQAHALSEVER
jgi:hypothetical protein